MTECDYCGNSELAYELNSDRGQVARCIPCLAIEQGQQALNTPYERYEESEILDEDNLKHSYESGRDWFRILARITQDEAIIKRDPEDIGTVGGGTRTFLTNIMGAEAHYPPSEIAGSEVTVGQTTLGDGGGD